MYIKKDVELEMSTRKVETLEKKLLQKYNKLHSLQHDSLAIVTSSLKREVSYQINAIAGSIRILEDELKIARDKEQHLDEK